MALWLRNRVMSKRPFVFCVTWLNRVLTSLPLHGSRRWRRWRLRQYCSRKEMFPSSERIISPFWKYLPHCKQETIRFPSASRRSPTESSSICSRNPRAQSPAGAGSEKKCLCSSRLWTSSPGPVHPGRPAGTRTTLSDRSLSSATWNWGSNGWSRKVRRSPGPWEVSIATTGLAALVSPAG